MAAKAENTREIKTAMDLHYMRRIRSSLSFLGSWPYKEFEEKGKNYVVNRTEFIFVIDIITLSTGILYLKNHVKEISFFELGHTYITVFMNVVGMQRICMPWLEGYRRMTKEFVLQYHLVHFKDRSDYSMKVYNQVHKICSFFCTFIHIQMYIGLVLFIVTPCFNNYMSGMYGANRPENGTYEHAVYYELPFDYTTNFSGYMVLFTFNCYISSICSFAFCLFDLYICIIVFHIWGHYKILIHNLENFPRPENESSETIQNVGWYNKKESEEITQMLIYNINYHKLITNFTQSTLNGFGYMMALYLAFHQVSGCILLFECSQLETEALAKYGPLTIILIQQLIQMSIVFELIRSKSETIKDSAYSVPWECMGTKNRKIFLFFLYNIQSSVELKAVGMVPIGIQTATAILKTSLSYFIMLRTFAADE